MPVALLLIVKMVSLDCSDWTVVRLLDVLALVLFIDSIFFGLIILTGVLFAAEAFRLVLPDVVLFRGVLFRIVLFDVILLISFMLLFSWAMTVVNDVTSITIITLIKYIGRSLMQFLCPARLPLGNINLSLYDAVVVILDVRRNHRLCIGRIEISGLKDGLTGKASASPHSKDLNHLPILTPQ